MDELSAHFEASTIAATKTIVDALIDTIFDSPYGTYIATAVDTFVALVATASRTAGDTKDYELQTKFHAYHASAVNTAMKTNFDAALAEWEDAITDSGMYDTVSNVKGDVVLTIGSGGDDIVDSVGTKTWGENSTDDYSGMTDCLIYKLIIQNYDGVYIAVGCGTGTVDKINRTVIQFDIKSDLEALGAVSITSANLYLKGFTSNGSHTVSAYRVLQNWGETTVTWNWPWNTVGCAAASDAGEDDGVYDRKATAESSDSTNALGAYNTVLDLTSLAQEWFAGTAKEYGVLLQSDNEAIGNWLRWYQSEDADGSKPYLEVGYSIV